MSILDKSGSKDFENLFQNIDVIDSQINEEGKKVRLLKIKKNKLPED